MAKKATWPHGHSRKSCPRKSVYILLLALQLFFSRFISFRVSFRSIAFSYHRATIHFVVFLQHIISLPYYQSTSITPNKPPSSSPWLLLAPVPRVLPPLSPARPARPLRPRGPIANAPLAPKQIPPIASRSILPLLATPLLAIPPLAILGDTSMSTRTPTR